MTPDVEETIVAIGSAPGGATRGIVRLAGPNALEIVSRLTGCSLTTKHPKQFGRVPVRLVLAGTEHTVPCDLLVWPDERSYAHQPAVELHTIGSPPLLDALVRGLTEAGARLAQPGEFTLRAFLAGRLDLTQAEAVLAVVDARHTSLLDTALAQLAGGLADPLNRLREELLALLADLEAGLDFVEEEDVRFVDSQVLLARLADARRLIHTTIQQTTTRTDHTQLPTVLLTGPPNVGKSRLFNALVTRFGNPQKTTEALVANQPGVTRDALRAEVCFHELDCTLIDTAGVPHTADTTSPVDALAQEQTAAMHTWGDLVLCCAPLGRSAWNPDLGEHELQVATMADLAPDVTSPDTACPTSAATGVGLTDLAERIADRLARTEGSTTAQVVTDTARRCRDTLAEASQSLARAEEAATHQVGEEIISFELRTALDALGRVVGEVVTDDVLDQIFSKFCIGK